jgi:hypothetical protein
VVKVTALCLSTPTLLPTVPAPALAHALPSASDDAKNRSPQAISTTQDPPCHIFFEAFHRRFTALSSTAAWRKTAVRSGYPRPNRVYKTSRAIVDNNNICTAKHRLCEVPHISCIFDGTCLVSVRPLLDSISQVDCQASETKRDLRLEA